MERVYTVSATVLVIGNDDEDCEDKFAERFEDNLDEWFDSWEITDRKDSE